MKQYVYCALVLLATAVGCYLTVTLEPAQSRMTVEWIQANGVTFTDENGTVRPVELGFVRDGSLVWRVAE
jgi:hypothetical protein